jgi:hypothetical protein
MSDFAAEFNTTTFANVDFYTGEKGRVGEVHLGEDCMVCSNAHVVWGTGANKREIAYSEIGLHAICRDVDPPYLYCQVDVSSVEEKQRDEYVSIEVRFVPRDKTTLDALYNMFSIGSQRNGGNKDEENPVAALLNMLGTTDMIDDDDSPFDKNRLEKFENMLVASEDDQAEA